MIHLTPFAPGCADRAIDDLGRRLWCGGGGAPAHQAALGALLKRLQRRATDVGARGVAGDEIAIMALSEPNKGWPLAFIWQGMDEAETRTALMGLAAAEARGRAA
jgi:hypothetical protein